MELFTFCAVSFCLFICLVNCQLVVNVRNNGGDVYRETIEANTTQDSISLDFRKSDGTLITHFIDGRNVNNDFWHSYRPLASYRPCNTCGGGRQTGWAR